MIQKPKEFIQDGHPAWLYGRVPFQSFVVERASPSIGFKINH
jgi:hypothetical protein